MKNINRLLVSVFVFFSLFFSTVSPIRATLSCESFEGVSGWVGYWGTKGIGSVGENSDIWFSVTKSSTDTILDRKVYVGEGGWVDPNADSYGDDAIHHKHTYNQPNDYIAAGVWVYRDGSGAVKTKQCIYDRLRVFNKEVKNYGVLRLNYPSSSISRTVTGNGSQIGAVNVNVFRGDNNGSASTSTWRLYINGGLVGEAGDRTSGLWWANSLLPFTAVYPSSLSSSALVEIVSANFADGEGSGAFAEANMSDLVVYSRNPPTLEPNPVPGFLFLKCEGRYFSEAICKWRLRNRINAGEGTCQLDPNLGTINSSGPNYWKWGFCSNGVGAVSTPVPTDVPTMPTNTPVPTNTPRPTSTPTPRIISTPSGSCYGMYYGEWQCNDRARNQFPGISGTCQLNPELGALEPDGPNYWKWSYCEAIGGVATVPTNTPRPTSTPTPRVIGGISTGTCHGQYFGEWQCKSRAEAQFPGVSGTCQLNSKLGTIDYSNPSSPTNYWKWSWCKPKEVTSNCSTCDTSSYTGGFEYGERIGECVNLTCTPIGGGYCRYEEYFCGLMRDTVTLETCSGCSHTVLNPSMLCASCTTFRTSSGIQDFCGTCKR